MAENIAEQVKISRVLAKICIRNSVKELDESTVDDVILGSLEEEKDEIEDEHNNFRGSITEFRSRKKRRTNRSKFYLAIDAMLKLSRVDPLDIIIDKKIMCLIDGPDDSYVKKAIGNAPADKLSWMIDSDVDKAREWLHSIPSKGINSWYVFPKDRLAKEVIMKCQIGGEITKFFSRANMEIYSSKGRARLGTTSVISEHSVLLLFPSGIGTGRFVKDLVELSKFFHLHMHLIEPEPVVKAKKRKIGIEEATKILLDPLNREHILYGNVHFIRIIDFPKKGIACRRNIFTLILVRQCN